MKKNKWILAVSLAVAAGIGVIVYNIFDFGRHEDQALIDAVNDEAVTANILLLAAYEDGSGRSFSADGCSGAIFKKDGGTYYALTALHGIPFENETARLIALGHDQPTYAAYTKTNGHVGLSGYYEPFYAALEYYDRAYDLAVISFSCAQEYAILPLADTPPAYGEPVAAVGNPNGYDRNLVTTGTITSNDRPFKLGGDTLMGGALEHTARLYDGNSGGALLNADMELAGINLGAYVNVFQKFQYGAAVPCDKIRLFLSDWEDARAVPEP